MNKMYIIYEMFTIESTVQIIKNNKITDTFQINPTNIKMIQAICKQNDINEIILCGNKDFLKKYKIIFNTEFENNQIKITIEGE
jgi:RNA-binding protein YlmH